MKHKTNILTISIWLCSSVAQAEAVVAEIHLRFRFCTRKVGLSDACQPNSFSCASDSYCTTIAVFDFPSFRLLSKKEYTVDLALNS
jgi:hypothetical protein